MNPTLHQPIETKIRPSAAEGTPHLYVLSMRYVPGGEWQTFLRTHVPVVVAAAVEAGDVAALHLETLPVNGPESTALPGRPKYLVLGFQSKDGRWIPSVPCGIKAAFRRRFLLGLVPLLAGLCLLTLGHGWSGAIALLFGSHALRTAMSIARVPFLTYFTVRGS